MLLKYELIEIESVNFEDDNFEDVYDLEIEENHSYTANEYIVHNCDTRIKTGVGVPQLSSIINCSDAVHGLGAHVISDGGCKTSADISKSFGAGADFVMIGSMLAGHKESGGETIENSDGSFSKEVYGMSSEHAMKKHYGEKNKYRASEGNYEVIPYRGLVKDTIEDLLGGIRSTCTYVGAKRLKDLSKCTTFIRVNRIK